MYADSNRRFCVVLIAGMGTCKAQDVYFDEYGIIPWTLEKARLLQVERLMARDADVVTYIGIHWTRSNGQREMMRRANRAKSFIVSKGRIAKNRIITVDGGPHSEPKLMFAPAKNKYVLPPTFP